MRILILGSGGREHAIGWALSRSPTKPDIFTAPGNAGTAEIGSNIDLPDFDLGSVTNVVQELAIDFVVIGPEQPLVDGLADGLREAGIPVVGPDAAAARLEGSKTFAKAFMQRHQIPTAAYRSFDQEQFDEALAHVRHEGAPIVIKASGLAAGKGAVVCMTLEMAEQVLREFMQEGTMGSAAETLVIESFMSGEEASVFVLTDGRHYALLATAQDHKRIGEGDTGPNTGGMGAYAPAPIMTDTLMQEVQKTIIEPTLEGMKAEGAPFRGILYIGLMISEQGPKVVEYNCRLGDPEAQVVLPLLESDAVEVFKALAEGNLAQVDVRSSQGAAACVVMASGGYPGPYSRGKRIHGLTEAARKHSTMVFHAGTRASPEDTGNSTEVVTSGGRVLAVSALGRTLREALDRAYAGVEAISFEGAVFRRDIGYKGLRKDPQT